MYYKSVKHLNGLVIDRFRGLSLYKKTMIAALYIGEIQTPMETKSMIKTAFGNDSKKAPKLKNKDKQQKSQSIAKERVIEVQLSCYGSI